MRSLTRLGALVFVLAACGKPAESVRAKTTAAPTEFLEPELEIEGSLALDLFRDQPFTIDYAAKRFVVEDETSLAARRSNGIPANVRVENDLTSTVVYLPLELLPGAKPLEMEVDTGSLHMILDDRFMENLAIDKSASNIERREGQDQTNHAYVRTYAHLPHAANVVGAKDVTMPAGATVNTAR